MVDLQPRERCEPIAMSSSRVRRVRRLAPVSRDAALAARSDTAAAGWRKYVNPARNQIGLHAISDTSGNEATDVTVLSARLLRRIGIPDQILAKIVLTPPEDLYYLTI